MVLYPHPPRVIPEILLKCNRIKNEDFEQTNTFQQKATVTSLSKSFSFVAQLFKFQYKAIDLCH